MVDNSCYRFLIMIYPESEIFSRPIMALRINNWFPAGFDFFQGCNPKLKFIGVVRLGTFVTANQSILKTTKK